MKILHRKSLEQNLFLWQSTAEIKKKLKFIKLFGGGKIWKQYDICLKKGVKNRIFHKLWILDPRLYGGIKVKESDNHKSR